MSSPLHPGADSPVAFGSAPKSVPVSLLIASTDREAALARLLAALDAQHPAPFEVVVLDNASSVPLAGRVAAPAGLRLRWDRCEVREGVAGARARLLGQASAPVALLLDDDAVPVARDLVGCVAGAFAAHSDMAALALPIRDFRSDPPRWLTPFGSRAASGAAEIGPAAPGAITSGGGTPGQAVRAAYFVGGAHALRVAAAAEVGGYDAAFTYGEEELDLSHRLLRAGFEVRYAPALVVDHRPDAPVSSTVAAGRIRARVRARVHLALRDLPAPYVLVHLALWLGHWTREAVRRGVPGEVARGLRDGLRDARRSGRRPLRDEALGILLRHGGRLWF